MNIAHRVRHGRSSFRDSNQVRVICHRIVGSDSQVVPVGVFAQQLQIEMPVLCVQEDVRAPISSLRDVMRQSRALTRARRM
jgi:hypothetical protein